MPAPTGTAVEPAPFVGEGAIVLDGLHHGLYEAAKNVAIRAGGGVLPAPIKAALLINELMASGLLGTASGAINGNVANGLTSAGVGALASTIAALLVPVGAPAILAGGAVAGGQVPEGFAAELSG